MDVQAAEATARFINAGKIIPGLLLYLTSPEAKLKALPPPRTAKKRIINKNREPRIQGLVEPSQASTKHQKTSFSSQERSMEDIPVAESPLKHMSKIQKATENAKKPTAFEDIGLKIAKPASVNQSTEPKEVKQRSRQEKVTWDKGTKAEKPPSDQPVLSYKMAVTEALIDDDLPATPPNIEEMESPPITTMTIVSEEEMTTQDICHDGPGVSRQPKDANQALETPSCTGVTAQALSVIPCPSSPYSLKDF